MTVAAAADTTATEQVTEATEATEAADDLLGDAAGAEGAEDAGAKKTESADDGDDLLDGKVGEEEKPEAAADGADEYGEFTIPEGYEADAELADISKPIFKELGLNKDQAQGLVEKLGPQILSKVGEKMAAQWKATQKQWAADAKKDADIFDASAKAVRPEVAVGRDYLGADFSAAIKQLGGNNHPAVLKALAKVGQALREDTPGFGKPAAKAKTAEQRLYPNDQPKS